MLEVNVNAKKAEFYVESEGTLDEVVADIMYVTSVIYEGLDKDTQIAFSPIISNAVNDKVYAGRKEFEKKIKEKKQQERKEEKKYDEKKIDELIERLKKEILN